MFSPRAKIFFRRGQAIWVRGVGGGGNKVNKYGNFFLPIKKPLETFNSDSQDFTQGENNSTSESSTSEETQTIVNAIKKDMGNSLETIEFSKNSTHYQISNFREFEKEVEPCEAEDAYTSTEEEETSTEETDFYKFEDKLDVIFCQ